MPVTPRHIARPVSRRMLLAIATGRRLDEAVRVAWAVAVTSASYRAVATLMPRVAHLPVEPRRQGSGQRGDGEPPRHAPQRRGPDDEHGNSHRGCREEHVCDLFGTLLVHIVSRRVSHARGKKASVT